MSNEFPFSFDRKDFERTVPINRPGEDEIGLIKVETIIPQKRIMELNNIKRTYDSIRDGIVKDFGPATRAIETGGNNVFISSIPLGVNTNDPRGCYDLTMELLNKLDRAVYSADNDEPLRSQYFARTLEEAVPRIEIFKQKIRELIQTATLALNIYDTFANK